MKDTVIQYKEFGDTRTITINNFADLYAYTFAMQRKYLNGVLALTEIEGDPPHSKTIHNIVIFEKIDKKGAILSSYANYRGEKINLEDLDLTLIKGR